MDEKAKPSEITSTVDYNYCKNQYRGKQAEITKHQRMKERGNEEERKKR